MSTSQKRHCKFNITGAINEGDGIAFDGQICYRIPDKDGQGSEWEMCENRELSVMQLSRKWAGKKSLLNENSTKGLISFMTTTEGGPQTFAFGGNDNNGVPFSITEATDEKWVLRKHDSKSGKKEWYDYTKEEGGNSQDSDVVMVSIQLSGADEECECKHHVKGSQGAESIQWILNGFAMVPSRQPS